MELWEKMRTFIKHVFVGLISFGTMASNATAQEIDIFDPEMTLFHAAKIHAIYAGVSQTINLNCGGDVATYANKFASVADTLPPILKQTYVNTFGNAYKCDRQKLNLFSEWENTYFEGLMNR